LVNQVLNDYKQADDLSNIGGLEQNEEFEMKGRNSRRPKKSNHGARPCSSYMRKMKQKGWYHKVKGD